MTRKIWNKPKVGVFGPGITDDKEAKEKAREIGRTLAEQECIVVTGGCGGLPYEAAKAASQKGGLVLGISPASNLGEHRERFGMPTKPYLLVFTGLGKKGRNPINVQTCDGTIFIGGRAGTCNEFTIAYDSETPIIVGLLQGVDGVANGYLQEGIKQFEKFGKISKVSIIEDIEPVELVKKVIRSIKNKSYKEG